MISVPASTSLPAVISAQAASCPTSQASPTTGKATGSATGSTPAASTGTAAAAAATQSSATSGSASTIIDSPSIEILLPLGALGVAVSWLGWL